MTERQWVRRGELLEAARAVFERDGYHGTTVSAIVQAAGLSQGAFYLYFADKKAVFAALQDEMATLLRRRIYWSTRDEADAGRRLEARIPIPSSAAYDGISPGTWPSDELVNVVMTVPR